MSVLTSAIEVEFVMAHRATSPTAIPLPGTEIEGWYVMPTLNPVGHQSTKAILDWRMLWMEVLTSRLGTRPR